MTKLQKDFNAAVEAYVKAFERKHKIKFEHWPGDYIGTVACMGDYFFNFKDMRYDIDNKLPEPMIFEWSDAEIDAYRNGTGKVNLNSWAMGLRHKDLK